MKYNEKYHKIIYIFVNSRKMFSYYIENKNRQIKILSKNVGFNNKYKLNNKDQVNVTDVS